MKPAIIKYIDYQDDDKLVSAIMELIIPSYKNAGSHIAKDIKLCNELYAINSENEEMLAFFMVGYHNIAGIECCYLGLSACHQEQKNNSFVKALYFAFARDCAMKELKVNSRILCYWTTATPIVYHWFCKYFSQVQPDRQGHCINASRSILTTIAQAKYKNATFDVENPFVLRHAAQQINYSDTEKERIEQAIKDLNLQVFDSYKLDETNGDRFLMYGYTPPHDKLIELTQ